MKILVTGVSGFIGSRLLEEICNKYGHKNVMAISSKKNINCKTIIYSEGFLIDKSELEYLNDIRVVIHAGAFTPKNKFESNDVSKCNGNVAFTNMMLSLPLKKLEKIIYLSTLDLYSSKGVIDEMSEISPMSFYAESKLYCEKMIEAYCKESNIVHQILRIGHVYGPGEDEYKKLIPVSIRNILDEGRVEIWGDGKELRSYIYIDDVVKACTSSIDYDVALGTVNVCGAKAISIFDLVQKLGKITGSKFTIVNKPNQNSKRDLVFNNQKMMDYLLDEETCFDYGLIKEVEHIRGML